MSNNGGGEMETTYYDVTMAGIGEWMCAKVKASATGHLDFNIVHRDPCPTLTSPLTLGEAINFVDPSTPSLAHLEAADVALCNCETVTVRVTQ